MTPEIYHDPKLPLHWQVQRKWLGSNPWSQNCACCFASIAWQEELLLGFRDQIPHSIKWTCAEGFRVTIEYSTTKTTWLIIASNQDQILKFTVFKHKIWKWSTIVTLWESVGKKGNGLWNCSNFLFDYREPKKCKTAQDQITISDLLKIFPLSELVIAFPKESKKW